MSFVETMKEKARQSIKTIVLPESTDPRVLKAAADVENEGFAKAVLVGDEEKIRQAANENNIDCQISLEERMGCGLGVCLGCAVKTASSPKDNPQYFHVCKGGPVFNSKDVEF